MKRFHTGTVNPASEVLAPAPIRSRQLERSLVFAYTAGCQDFTGAGAGKSATHNGFGCFILIRKRTTVTRNLFRSTWQQPAAADWSAAGAKEWKSWSNAPLIMSPITAPIAPITVVKDEKEEEHGDEQHSASYDASASQSPSDSEERSRTEGRASSEDHIVDVEETSQTPLETTTASDPDGTQIPGKRGRMLSRDVCRPQPAVFCQHCPGRKSNTRETKREDFSLFLPHPLPIYLIIFL